MSQPNDETMTTETASEQEEQEAVPAEDERTEAGPAEEEKTEEQSSLPPDVREGIRAEGERRRTPRAEKSVSDEAEDYIIGSDKKRVRRKRKHSHGSSHHHHVSVSDDFPLVRSDHTPHGSHHHHHHHHHSSSGPSSHSSSHSRHHHSSGSSKKKIKKSKKILLIALSVFMALVLLIVSTVSILIILGNSELYGGDLNIVSPGLNAEIQDDGEYIIYKGQIYKYNHDVASMLFMGIDRRNLEEYDVTGLGGQADVIVVMAMNFRDGSTKMLTIPRDTYTDVAIYSLGGTYVGMEKQQICLAYAYGDGKEKSAENVLATVRRIFYNVPIRTYFALDLDGIAKMNDAVGGVDVTSPETIGSFASGKDYHLVGMEAESFVRDRNHETADANLYRMQRQEIYAKSFMNTVISQTKKDLQTPLKLFNESAPYSCTNLNPATVTAMASGVVTSRGMSFDVQQVPGEVSMADEEHAKYTIDEEAFFEQFLSVYYTKVDSISQIQ